MRKVSDVLEEFFVDMTAYKASLEGKEYEAARDRAYERAEQGISFILAAPKPKQEDKHD